MKLPTLASPQRLLSRVLETLSPQLALLVVVAGLSGTGCSSVGAGGPDKLASALTFHASFDRGVNADFGKGDLRLMNAPSMDKRAEATPGLPAGGEVQLAEGVGRFGNALRFVRKSPLMFYQAQGNFTYRTNLWSGTVSFWLSVDPAADLAMSYCDPLQITPRSWNDAAFFVEFEKRTNEVPFRLGVYPDFKVWNPQNRKWEDLPVAEKPLVTVPPPTPFGRGRWTHVAFTFENFNSGRPDGVATVYLNGQPAATIPARTQTFTWDLQQTLVMLGVGYLGLWDELSLFNRALTPAEIAELYALPEGVAGLHR